MISINSIKKIVHTLHWGNVYDSVKECSRDTRGGFLIPTSSKVIDIEYAKYRHLPINWDLAPITKDDLPEDFSPQAIKTVDMFRRKTIDLPYECDIF
jgi:hypothetical protein